MQQSKCPVFQSDRSSIIWNMHFRFLLLLFLRVFSLYLIVKFFFSCFHLFWTKIRDYQDCCSRRQTTIDFTPSYEPWFHVVKIKNIAVGEKQFQKQGHRLVNNQYFINRNKSKHGKVSSVLTVATRDHHITNAEFYTN